MSLPFLTARHGEIRAMTRKRPAVMKSPIHPHLRPGLYPLKQQLNIDVIPVNIMEPQKSGLYSFAHAMNFFVAWPE